MVCWSTPWWALADSALPWPVSKYMTLSPTVPRARPCAASRASASSARLMPKAVLARSLPATDWNTRSTGAPCAIARSVLVTWVSTHDCVGISKRLRSASSICSSETMAPRLSEAGLMPMVASPHPYSRPSMTEAAMPLGSSVGWFGCSRTASRPGRPTVLRKRVTTWHLRATATRSWLRISLLTAAAISGVMPGATRASVALSVSCRSSQLRRSPMVVAPIVAKAEASCRSTINRVISSASYGTSASLRNCVRGTSASARRAAIRSCSLAAAMPASASPERAGLALASSVRRSSKTWR
ncbi:hypothetical protein D9M68_324610 [compost metagenome]